MFVEEKISPLGHYMENNYYPPLHEYEKVHPPLPPAVKKFKSSIFTYKIAYI